MVNKEKCTLLLRLPLARHMASPTTSFYLMSRQVYVIKYLLPVSSTRCVCVYVCGWAHLDSNLYSSPSPSSCFRWESSVQLAALNGIGCFRSRTHARIHKRTHAHTHTHTHTHSLTQLLLLPLLSFHPSIQHSFSLVLLSPASRALSPRSFTHSLYWIFPTIQMETNDEIPFFKKWFKHF